MKTCFLLLCSICFYSAQAQDTTLAEYAGKYIFPEGSVVPSAEVTFKDTVLMVSSVQGVSVLKKLAKDTFILVSYNGTASFKRNTAGIVSGVRVEVDDLLLEGNKETDSTRVLQKKPIGASKDAVVK